MKSYRQLLLTTSFLLLALQGMAQSATWLIRPLYDGVEPYCDNVWKVRENGKVCLMSIETGRALTHAYDSITYFTGNYAMALLREGKLMRVAAIIQRQGLSETMVKGANYATQTTYSPDGVFPVQNKKGKQGFIDKNGQLVVKCKYAQVYPFSQGRAYAESKPGKGFYINASGAKASDQSPRDEANLARRAGFPIVDAINNSVRGHMEHGVYGLTDSNGHSLVPPQFERLGTVYGQLVPAGMSGKWGLLLLADKPMRLEFGYVDKQCCVKVHTAAHQTATSFQVVLEGANGSKEMLMLHRQVDAQTFAYAINKSGAGSQVAVYYDGLLQARAQVVNCGGTVADSPTASTGAVLKMSVGKKSKKADANDNEYLYATLTNTGKGKDATFVGTVTIYIDGKALATTPSSVTIAAGKSVTVSATVSGVKKERAATVKVVAVPKGNSHGAQSASNKVSLKPFY